MTYSEIGLIPKTQPVLDDDGNELTPATYHEGWHVNTLRPVPEWEAYIIPTPEKPFRIYAGGMAPTCYRFPDRETFRDLLPEPEDDT